jgi:hypothetical protein
VFATRWHDDFAEHRAVLVAMSQAWKLLAQFHCFAAPPEYRYSRTLIKRPEVASMYA